MASLSNEEQQRLAAALTRLIDSGKFVNLSNFHGYPPNVCPDLRQQVCCPHNGPTFLPWHRLFMVQMEEELGEALPYWDWTEDAELPRFWSESSGRASVTTLALCPLMILARLGIVL